MRKVLLTTTALVALGGVSAASALEISGFQRFIYSSWDDTAAEAAGENDSELVQYFRIQFDHAITTDSGLDISMRSRYNNIQAATESYENISIGGDFGKFSVGNMDNPGFNMTTGLLNAGKYVDDIDQTFVSGTAGTNLSGAVAGGQLDEAGSYAVSYTFPSVAGFTAQIAQADSGTTSEADTREFGVMYQTTAGNTGITVSYISSKADSSDGATDDETDHSEMSLVAANGPFTLRYGTSNNETIGTDGVTDIDREANEASLEYQVSDALVAAFINLNSKDGMDDTNNTNVDQNIFAARYTMAPGVLVYASYADFDYEGATANSGSQTNIGLRVNF